MRYYIVDNMGNIWSESESLEYVKARMGTYTEEEIKENELEIIEGR